MAQNRIIVRPDTTTVTVSSVGLTGPAGASGADAFPYTGSAIVSGSLEVIGKNSITGSIYLTNGTADDSYYTPYDAKYYHEIFAKNPSSFTILNSQHQTFTGSTTPSFNLYASSVNFTDIDISGSAPTGYGLFQRTRIQGETKMNDLYNLVSICNIGSDVTSSENTLDQLENFGSYIDIIGTNPINVNKLIGIPNRISINNPNFTNSAGSPFFAGLWNRLTLTTGSATNVNSIFLENQINSNFTIEGTFANISADSDVIQSTSGSYNIYMPAAMDSVLGGGLRIGGDTQLTGSLTLSGSNYLVPGIVNADSGDTVVLTGSAYDSTPMIKVTHQRSINGDITMTLPDATLSNSTNRTIRFISDSTVDNQHRAIISPSGSQTLDGGSGFTMDRSYEGIMVWSDGTEWFKIQAKNV